ncbi:TetR/AcrR family transcriptional regulator [Herpetosiphon llansteffanensis]|uniref:TetR/AcrR family transcriptional regulator n=1 Tax=Herpetosiphon llansteffanensis TaxID=2094568 RepID=UPI000D7C3F1F|nr:TetR/AcrR family transcriptional regulator [Herpetosiphon llansteffanensis]
MSKRDLILSTALELFNRQGTADVSTNHIAEACSISPGNLYYHFRNKAAIIQALFEQLYNAWDTELSLPTARPAQLSDLTTLVETNYQIIWRYRFAYRELVALLHHDSSLHASFLATRQRGFAGFRSIVEQFISAGIMQPLTANTLDQLIQVCWLISEFWLNNLEINQRPIEPSSINTGVNLMLHVLQPYIIQGSNQ